MHSRRWAATLTADADLHGQTMREGQMVAMLFNSANNDERQFKDPDRFDITRNNPGKASGVWRGLHACLGAPLARPELKVAMEYLLTHWPDFMVMPDRGERFFSPFTQGYRHLPMRLRGPD